MGKPSRGTPADKRLKRNRTPKTGGSPLRLKPMPNPGKTAPLKAVPIKRTPSTGA